MSLTVKHFNTWAGCLFDEHRPDYYDYIRHHADLADVFHLSEVHSCNDPDVPDFVNPADAGHREGPLHVRQFQVLEAVLGDTHRLYYEPQMNGLHDLDATHPTIQYGNVTCVRKGLLQDVAGGMMFRTFNDLNDQKNGGAPAGKSGHSVIVHKDDTWYQSVSTHGHWDERSKIDTRYRWQQFTTMMSFAHNHRCGDMIHSFDDIRLIVGGDFNITSQCEVLEGIRKSTQFGEGGGVILNHEFQDGDTPLATRTTWYPPEKEHREANFVIVGKNVQVERFAIDDTAPSDHCMITTVLK